MLTDVKRIVNTGSVIEPASVTLFSRTQSTFDDENLPENLTTSPGFIVANDLNSEELGSINVLDPMSETALFQVET